MLHQGDKINIYTLEKYLGKGSYGEVWLAKKSIELSDDGILVALKFLSYQPNKDKTQEDFLKQVKREVGTWIKASGHKNIVSVQDGFAFRDDTFVIVSDFAESGSLGDWLQKNGGKSPNLEKTVEIMSEILDALTHLHTQQPDKIIHRDLKPDNILFKSGVPCITDFGVSRMSQTITQSMAQVAATSAGTPLYMSPESFNNQPASRSMDIWSAGVILYQMLSGNFPFYADNPFSLALEVISGNPPKPLPNDIPNEFKVVVARALEKDVNQRYQTADDMKTGLKEALKTWEKAKYQPNPLIDIQTQPNAGDTIIDDDFQFPPIQNLKGLPPNDDEKARILAETQKLPEIGPTKEAEIQPLTVNFVGLESENDIRKKDDRENQRRKISTIVLAIVGLGGIGLPILLFLSWTKSWGNSNQPIANIPTNYSVNNNANKSSNITGNLPTNKLTNLTTTDSSGSDSFKNSIGMEFVKITSGTFMMGSPESEKGRNIDETEHQVTISKSFYLGKYEVTQGQWIAVMGSNPSKFSGCGDNCPVEYVNWQDIQEFIKKLNEKGEGTYRLPTEAEWEFACRAGTIGAYNGSNLSDLGWYGENSDDRTHPVGQKKANAWGVYDMHGNVYERVQDWYGNYPNGSVVDPKGQSTGTNLVVRGGSWGGDAINVRAATRSSGSPTFRLSDVGFRLVKEN